MLKFIAWYINNSLIVFFSVNNLSLGKQEWGQSIWFRWRKKNGCRSNFEKRKTAIVLKSIAPSYISVTVLKSVITPIWHTWMLGGVSSNENKRVSSRQTLLQCEHICMNFNCPMREWAEWGSPWTEWVSKVSVVKRSAIEWVEWAVWANERSERPSGSLKRRLWLETRP